MDEINDVSELGEKDLYDLVEEGSYIEELLNGRGGDILRKATDRVIARYEYQYVIAEKISEQEYKMAIKFYKYKMFEAFKHLIEDGHRAKDKLDGKYGEPTSEQGDEHDS